MLLYYSILNIVFKAFLWSFNDFDKNKSSKNREHIPQTIPDDEQVQHMCNHSVKLQGSGLITVAELDYVKSYHLVIFSENDLVPKFGR